MSGAIGFGLAWQLQTGNLAEQTQTYKDQISKLELEHKDERIALQRAARTAAEGHLLRVSKAQESAQVRVVALRRDAVAAGIELDSLRTQSAATLRAATENAAACIADATAKTIILAQCAERYADVAAAADSWASDAKMMVEAWPR